MLHSRRIRELSARLTLPSGPHPIRTPRIRRCEDHFAALPGFKIHQYYDDFSTPCFDGEHNVIMGGSFASSGDLSSVFARFHFRPHFHQHAGFRVVKAEHLVTSSMDAPPPHAGGWVPPSSDPAKRLAAAAAGGAHGGADALGRTLLLHYGAADEALGTLPAGPLRAALAVGLAFPANVAEMVAAAAARYGVPKGRVLDIGCAVGGTAFHLARAGFADVLGIDPSAAFIRAAEQIRSTGALPYSCRDEGDSSSSHVAKRPALPAAQGNGAAAAQEAPKGVAFKQMDASCLAPDLGTFDCVVVEGTLDKMTSPKVSAPRWGLSRLPRLLLLSADALLLLSCLCCEGRGMCPRACFPPSLISVLSCLFSSPRAVVPGPHGRLPRRGEAAGPAARRLRL